MASGMKVIFLALSLFSLCALFGCIAPIQNPTNNSINITKNTTVNATSHVSMTQQLCESSGGKWNECGSACAGEPPGTVCTQECVELCECGNELTCPPAFTCKIVPSGKGSANNMGFCKAQ